MAETATTTEEVKDATSTTATETPTTQTQSTDADQLGEAGKRALAAERKRADDAEKLAKKLQADADKAAADKAAADAKEAEQKGEWERLATERAEALKQREDALRAAADERDALKARLDARNAEDRAMIDAWVKDHKPIIDEYLDYRPGEDAPAEAQMAWFNATRPKVEKRVANPVNGNGRNPPASNGVDAKADDEARRRQEQHTTRVY